MGVRNWVVLGTLLSASPLLATNLPPATVSFLDGSFLRGELLSVRGDALAWRHPNARQPLEFTTTNLNDVQFSPRTPQSTTNDGPRCRLRLAGGDEVEGRLVSLDAERFELETWFAGRLSGRRAGLVSLTFQHADQPTYEGPQAADEWRISSSGGGNVLIRRFGDGFINNVVPAPPALPPNPPRVVEVAPAPAPKPPTAQELVLQLKAEIASLGDKVTPVVKETLANRLKAAEEQLTRQAAEKAAGPAPVPGIPPPPVPVRPEPRERRAQTLFNGLVLQLGRQGEKTLVDYVTRWEMALKDGLRLPNPAVAGEAVPAVPPPVANAVAPRPIRAAPVVPNNPVPPPAPAVDPAELALRMEIQRKLVEQRVNAGDLPPLPAAGLNPIAAVAAKPARKVFSEAELHPLVAAAEKTRTLADFLKSELVRTALAEKQTSRAVLEQWFAEFEQPAAWQNDPVKTARFVAMLRAEVHLLERRLAGKAAPFDEQRPLAPPVAAAPAAADELARTMQMMNEAKKAETVEAFLKSDLVKAAIAASQASERALERWFEEFAKPAELQADPQKAARFGERVRAEAALLAGRLLPRLNPPQPFAAPLAGIDVQAAAPAQPAGPAWTFRDGAFYSLGTGTLGRECHLPTKARVEFDLAWKGQPYFRFQFYTRSVEHFDFSDGWQFYSSGSGLLYPMRRGGGMVTPARVPQMVSKSSVRLTFLLDTEKESIVGLVDGEKVAEWKALGRPGHGTGIVFYNYNASARIRLSNIRITPWDGTHGEPPPAAEPKEAAVQFVNQDRATGTVQEIRNGRLALDAAGTRLEIPLTRIAAVLLPTPVTPALTNAHPIQLSLHRNERLSLALEKWEAGEITATSPVFGQLRLQPAAVRTLRFNPTAARAAADEWGGMADNLLPRP